jgi:hypothetical protein
MLPAPSWSVTRAPGGPGRRHTPVTQTVAWSTPTRAWTARFVTWTSATGRRRCWSVSSSGARDPHQPEGAAIRRPAIRGGSGTPVWYWTSWSDRTGIRTVSGRMARSAHAASQPDVSGAALRLQLSGTATLITVSSPRSRAAPPASPAPPLHQQPAVLVPHADGAKPVVASPPPGAPSSRWPKTSVSAGSTTTRHACRGRSVASSSQTSETAAVSRTVNRTPVPAARVAGPPRPGPAC